jgi:hypothetical protein
MNTSTPQHIFCMTLFNSILNILRFNRRNWKAIILCIFAATIFWFFNALNKTWTTNLSFPLHFDFDSKMYVPVKSLPEKVRINVTGNGWDLFKRSAGVKVTPLEIPLERPSEIKKLVGSTLPVFFTSQMNGLQINYVITDTLYVDLEPRAGRWIKLTMDSLNYNLKDGYLLASEVSITPDSVFLEGPMRLVNKFEEPVPLQLRHRNIDEDFSEDVEIEIPSSDVIRRDPPTVAVEFQVEKAVVVQDSIEIAVENLPPTVSEVERRKVPVTLEIPESAMSTFNINNVKAVLNLKNFQRGEARLLPRVDGLPPFSEVTRIDSLYIKL